VLQRIPGEGSTSISKQRAKKGVTIRRMAKKKGQETQKIKISN